mgnify:CR=1 FL=1
MLVYRTFSDLRKYLDQKDLFGKTIGFVPTMGALHKGHMSLVQKSNQLCDISVTSIFVNPAQFNKVEDLKKYPRNEEVDIQMLEVNQCDVVFIPEVDEVYPEGLVSPKVDLKGIDLRMEGKHRPGHFDGVVQVVGRFFDQIRPQKAFFGEKDFQQVSVIEQMERVLNYKVEIVRCAIVREDSGLAMSSRNKRLSDVGLTQAVLISEQLQWVKNNFNFSNGNEIQRALEKAFKTDAAMELEYFEIVDEVNLQPLKSTNNKARAFMAVELEGIRLIDNIALY